MALFDPIDYLALPGCLEKETVEVDTGFHLDLDLAAIKMNQEALQSYFASLPPYQGWFDFLPFVNGVHLLAKLTVLIGDRAGAWEIYPDLSIKRKSRIPKPSRGDLENAQELDIPESD
jgi:hypothetical protein